MCVRVCRLAYEYNSLAKKASKTCSIDKALENLVFLRSVCTIALWPRSSRIFLLMQYDERSIKAAKKVKKS